MSDHSKDGLENPSIVRGMLRRAMRNRQEQELFDLRVRQLEEQITFHKEYGEHLATEELSKDLDALRGIGPNVFPERPFT